MPEKEKDVIEVPASGAVDGKKAKTTQTRYVFMDEERGWYEKEKDNVRITK